MTSNKTLIIILGPTAVGKTALSIHIAELLHTEILSADSRQFFKEMSIGTAKPSPEEMQGIKHHFIDFLSIEEDYNAGAYESAALDCLEKIFRQKDTAILTGGSGLYINAVCNGFDELPKTDEKVRADLIKKYRSDGIEALQKQLKILDPVYYDKADLNNPQRIIRALEVCLVSGRPYSNFRSGKQKPRNFNILKIGLERDRKELYQRIDERVDEMIKSGLEKEVRSLLPYLDKNALQTVGYKELFDYFEGKHDLRRAIELIKQNTRRFAKRQLTWFRKDKKIHWFHPNEKKAIIDLIKSNV